jgi:hypothetical protein
VDTLGQMSPNGDTVSVDTQLLDEVFK